MCMDVSHVIVLSLKLPPLPPSILYRIFNRRFLLSLMRF